MEIGFPLLHLLEGERSLLAIGNSGRMILFWFPIFLFALIIPAVESFEFERKIRKVFQVTLVLNFGYSIIQVLVGLGFLPDFFIVTKIFEPFAVDSHFRIIQGWRVAGFFTNTSALAVFSTAMFALFCARYVADGKNSDLFFSCISIALVLMTQSRASIAAVCIILGITWIIIPKKYKFLSSLAIFSVIFVSLEIVNLLIGLDEFFSRFIRLREGVLEDYSFGKRYYEIWPLVLHSLDDYPLGTLLSPAALFGVVDSGYLTYFAQGKWIFLMAPVLLIGTALLLGIRGILWHQNWPRLCLLFLGIYLSGAMITMIPLRSPIIAFLLVFSFWSEHAYRHHDRYQKII
jgi:hypothetical protein